MHMFRKLEYVPREGYYLQFDELMRPYLLDLFESDGYTVINVEQVFRLSSTYAVRLVELMLQYQNIKSMKSRGIIERSMKLDELRFALNVPDDAYKGRFDNFCANVLDSPIREINAKTMYCMSYETLRLARKDVNFKFTFDMTAVLKKEAELSTTAAPAIDKLRELGFSEKAALAIRQKCDGDEDCLTRIRSATRALSIQKKRGAIENELGFLRKYIEENWQGSPSKVNRSLPPPIAEVLAKENAPSAMRQSAPTPIGEVLRGIFPSLKKPDSPRIDEKPPESRTAKTPAPDDFREGELPLSATIADMLAGSIARNEFVKSSEEILKMRGLSLERFKELYMA